MAEVVVDPQVQSNGYAVDLEHATEGPYQLVGAPMKFQRTPGAVRNPAPELGQNTEEILLELGYSWDDIQEFKARGAIIG